jgi:hypothetical protein
VAGLVRPETLEKGKGIILIEPQSISKVVAIVLRFRCLF